MLASTGDAFMRAGNLLFSEAGPRHGRPVLLSPSLMLGIHALEPIVERLAPRGYRVLTWDHRGQGHNRLPRPRQTDPAFVDLNLTTLVADVKEMIEREGLHKPHIVGEGMGGMVALRMAAWHPGLIASVTAIAAAVDAEAHREALLALASHIEKHGVTGEIDLGEGTAPVADLLSQACFGASTLQSRPALVSEWRQRITERGRTPAMMIGFPAAMRALAQRDSIAEDLGGCRTPVLAIAGAEDVIYPPAVSGARVAEVTGGRDITIGGAGHSPTLEQPDAVVAQLVDQFQLVDPVS